MTEDNANSLEEPPPDNSSLDKQLGDGILQENMGPGSSFAHLYRGEIHRMRFWRERLDQTSNWAITLMAAILTYAFSKRSHPHYIILLAVATVSIFMLIEARRFRAYDIWRSRVRMIQQNAWAYGLDPDQDIKDENWREKLSLDYHTPNMKLSLEEALAHRLRRVYLLFFLVLLAAWLLSLTAYLEESWPTNAAIGPVPGTVVTTVVAAFYLGLISIAYSPRTWHVNGEILPNDVSG